MESTKKNLFAAAKKTETPKSASASKMPVLPVPPELEPTLIEYTEAKTNEKNWKAKKEMAEGIIKSAAGSMFLEECKKANRNIGSFKLGSVTVSVQDKYAKMDMEFAAVVENEFPDVIETTTEYGFDQAILGKYIEQISDALAESGIPEEDLLNLITKTEVKSVKKGTIDTLMTYKEKADQLYQVIQPVISMR